MDMDPDMGINIENGYGYRSCPIRPEPGPFPTLAKSLDNPYKDRFEKHGKHKDTQSKDLGVHHPDEDCYIYGENIQTKTKE